jgi:hypothetical protein
MGLTSKRKATRTGRRVTVHFGGNRRTVVFWRVTPA